MSAPPTAEQIRRMCAVTAIFNGLRGLMLLPAGLWLLAYGACFLFAPAARDWALAALIIMVGAMAAITRHYRGRFGQVRTGDTAVQWGAAVVALVLFMASGIPVNLLLDSPIWPQGLQIVLIMAIMTQLPPLLRRRPADLALTRHWQVMCVLVGIAAVIPLGLLTGGAHPLNATDALGQGTMLAVLGVCYIAGGLLDHRVLVRSLTAPGAGDR
ncbi:MAG: hypothetical protein GEV11_10525 [Streptosporangiales bacterium]|nr:hypothetical protein [Streptosporangiales bacterium]